MVVSGGGGVCTHTQIYWSWHTHEELTRDYEGWHISSSEESPSWRPERADGLALSRGWQARDPGGTYDSVQV